MFKKPFIEFVSPEKHWADNIDEIIVPCIKNAPEAFKEIKPWNGLDLKQRISNMFETKSSYMNKTIKQCDGIIKLWQRSFLLKFPCDVVLDVKKDEGWRFNTADKIMHISGHGQEQYGKMMPNTWAIKFTYNLFLNNNVDIIPLSPVYHKRQPYEVLPGVIFQKHKSPSILNIIAVLPNQTESYFFKKGDPLCLLYTKGRTELKSKFDSTARLIMPTF
jgi:hypothetical protein